MIIVILAATTFIVVILASEYIESREVKQRIKKVLKRGK